MFRTSYSTDGGLSWHVLEPDSDNYWWAARQARDRTRLDPSRIERVENLEIGLILIAYSEGNPDSRHYTPSPPVSSGN